MRVLIADDEPVARLVLRELLEEIAGVTVVGEAASGAEAVSLAAQTRPDVLLLDLQMPGMSGFEAASHFPSSAPPAVVFVTAFHQHALQAFDAGAVDYVLKPVRRERLEAALGKAKARLAGMTPAQQPAQQNELRKIVGKLGSDLHLLDPAEVVAFQAEGDVVHILTANRRYYASHSLKTLEEKLPAGRFRRVHRSTIVNADQIRKISPLSSKRWLLRMSNGMDIVVSKRMGAVIRDALGD
ncbi:MAG: response regulator transcription factor [Bryobacterales bacterium]|nr:response regulator transcription factor [Bryobacterales bacterium]